MEILANNKKQSIEMDALDIFVSVFHLRSIAETVTMFLSTVFFSIVAHNKVIFAEHEQSFSAIWIVVGVDFFFGACNAIRTNTFRTMKALKVIYYGFTYTIMLYMILQVERGYPSAFWMSDAIVMPILTFQIISILKNMSLLNLIPQGTLLEILSKIDNHKEITNGRDTSTTP